MGMFSIHSPNQVVVGRAEADIEICIASTAYIFGLD